jgi:hypothetical protein
MKKLILIVLICLPFAGFPQTFKIKVGTAPAEHVVDQITNAILFNSEIKKISIKKDAADNPAKTYKLQVDTEEPTFSTDGAYHDVVFTKDIRNKSAAILDENGTILHTFSLAKSPVTDDEEDSGTDKAAFILPRESATQYITNMLYPNQIVDVSGVGLRIAQGARATRYAGPQYVHLFFDQNGNTLLQSIPAGISRARYVVHIVYLVPKDNPQLVDYKVNQNFATVEEGVVIRGDGSLNNPLKLQAKTTGDDVVQFEWRHFEMALTGSSSDIKFDIVRNGYELKAGVVEMREPQIVATRVIKMHRIYHGSIDVGILETTLANPTYALVASDIDAAQKVVKRTNEGRRTFASAMYTFYVSPVVLLEKVFAPHRVRNYRLEGRNFVDDHRIYERIYPAFGIGLNDRLLDNIFLGGKWEFSRGGSVFMGYHKGKVNDLEVDDNFKFSETNMSQQSFDLKSKTKWAGSFCVGLNLDVRIITNLFQAGSQAEK